MPVPCLDNVRIDVYVPPYKSRAAWTLRQLGIDLAQQEVAGWQGARAPDPILAAAAASAHARLGIEKGTEPDPLLAPASDVSDHAALKELLHAFVDAVIARIGKDGLSSTWNQKRKAYVITQELASPGPGVSSTQYTSREPAHPTCHRTPRPLMPGIASRDSFPAVTGAAAYRMAGLQPHEHIQAVFKTGMIESGSGVVRKLTSSVGPYEGFHLHKLVLDNGFSRTLEVGVVNGMSALYITAALEKLGAHGKHVGIDPFQSTQWDNAGRATLERAGLSHRCTIIEEPSYLALPKLLRERHGQQFGLILVDGMHLFDFTLVDLFYADLLVRVGGIIVLDDIRHAGVSEALRYISGNYLHWQRVHDTICSTTMATFVKLAPDTRAWDFHVAL